MTFLVERLAELRKHLEHLRALRPRIGSAAELRRDLSLHNDTLFSLLTVCQLVIDVAGELSGRAGLAFDDYTQAIRNLAHYPEIGDGLVQELDKLPGFRNVLIHEYVNLDLDLVVQALDRLDPVEEFAEAVAAIEERSSIDG